MPYVYAFDHKHRKPPMELKDLLGGKGANLAEMTSVLGLPVPPGFTITTDACRAYMAGGLAGRAVRRGRPATSAGWRRRWEKSWATPSDPLLVSVRSGAKFSMPGMMDTVLNLGLNDASVKGLADQTSDERFAYDSYRRFISMYGRIVLGIDGGPLRRALRGGQAGGRRRERRRGPGRGAARPVRDLQAGRGGRHRPSLSPGARGSAAGRHRGGVRVVERRPGRGLPGPGAHPPRPRHRRQRPDHGVRQPRRQLRHRGRLHPRPGHAAPRASTATSWSTPRARTWWPASATPCPLSALQDRFPEIFKELMGIFARLEAHYRDMCDTEFTIEQGKLWMLQTRVGKRTGRAALRMAVDMTKQRGWKITREEAVLRVTAEHLDQVLHPQFAEHRPDRDRHRAWPPRRAPRSARPSSTPTGPRRPRRAASGSSWSAARPRPRTCTA